MTKDNNSFDFQKIAYPFLLIAVWVQFFQNMQLNPKLSNLRLANSQLTNQLKYVVLVNLVIFLNLIILFFYLKTTV